jgi:carbonic anhydrase
METAMPACACCLPRRAVVAGLAATAFGLRRARADSAAPASRILTPDQAVAMLMAGNQRYLSGKPQVCSVDIAALRQATADKQTPFAAVLSCSDSRVPAELVFDQTIGDLFVARVAGNIVSADVIASLEYGAAVLGTRAIMVLGHANCGAVKAAIDGKAVPGQISTLYHSLQPAVTAGGRDLTKAIQANARIQAALLRESSPVLADLMRHRKLAVVAGYYELASGKVSMLA